MKKKLTPTPDPDPNWHRPVRIQYDIAFDKDAWRKVHPPHLDQALAAGEAAIRAHLQSVTPPYAVAEVRSTGTYSDHMWNTEMPERAL